MAGDIPNYGKDISVDDVVPTDESDGNECATGNPKLVPAEKLQANRKTKGRYGFILQAVPHGGNVMQRQQAYIGIDNYRFIQKFLSVVAPRSACQNTLMIY